MHDETTPARATGAKESRNNPSDMDGPGFSSASYRPGYPIDRSLQECSETDLKRGFKKGV